jgi:predicted nucleotidyltransferase
MNLKSNSRLNSPITSEQLSIYRQTAQNNWQKTQKLREERLEKAWRLVEVATTLLKEKFGVTKVMIFGSILHENCFTLWSDVDIAAWGISPTETFQAMGEVRELDDTIEINLVDINACSQQLKDKISQEGKEF